MQGDGHTYTLTHLHTHTHICFRYSGISSHSFGCSYNRHWTCIVIFMKEKRIQYYNSNTVGAGKSCMDIVLMYLVDEDKGQHCIKHNEWALVISTESVPNKKNHLTVVHSFAVRQLHITRRFFSFQSSQCHKFPKTNGTCNHKFSEQH